MRITTNGHRREMLTYAELSGAEREMFDYVDTEDHYTPRFVRAYGSVYDVHDVQAVCVNRPDDTFTGGMGDVNVSPDSPLARWHGIASESVWTGTVFRLLGDGFGGLMEDDGFVVVGHYTED